MPLAVRAPRGVLAAALLLLAALAPARAPLAAEPEFPPLDGDVMDMAGVLSPQSKAAIAAWTADFQRQTGYRMVVATLPSLKGEDITPVAHRLGTEWGLENGVLLLEAPAESWVRIEVGAKLKDRLPDVICGTLLKYDILPLLRAGRLDEAMEGGAIAIMRRLGWTGDPAGATPPPPAPERYIFGFRIPRWLAVAFDFAVAGFILIVKAGAILERRRPEIVYSYEMTQTGMRRTDPGHEDEFIPFDEPKKKKRGNRRHKGNRKRKRRPVSGASGQW